MTTMELTRLPGERRRYALGEIGTIALQGLLGRSAAAASAARTWRLARRGFWGTLEATDEEGTVVGSFAPRAIRRGGTLTWAGRSYALRPASAWREKYALVDGERELALLEGKGWGRRPVKVELDDRAALEPGLLLFAVFVVRGLAEDASSAAGAASTTASMGAV